VKIEQLIVQHLYNNKYVSLQGIGIFKLRPDVSFPVESDKDFTIAADAFSFEHNLKAGIDDSLVEFIVQQTGKIKPLAFSDLESYAILAKQFLNLGKPLLIDGVGTVQKSQRGEYEFTPGQFVNPKIDDIFKPIKERTKDEVSFESESTAGNSNKNLTIGLIVAVIALAGFALYYFLVLKNVHENTPVEEATTIIADTTKKDTTKILVATIDTAAKKVVDSIQPKIDTPVATHLSAVDTSNFAIVLKDYPTRAEAQRAYKRLTNWGHKLTVITVDSTKYKLVMPFASSLSDTLRAKDSLRRFFGGKPYVQLK